MWWQDASSTRSIRARSRTLTATAWRPQGIKRRLDHLAWLGVDALWLSPIYPSPMHDSATTWPTTRTSIRSSARSTDFDSLVAAARSVGCACCSTWCPATPRSSTPGSASTRLVHLVGHPEQLVLRIRGLGVEPPRRALLPALVLSRAARPRLAQPRGGGRYAGCAALLDRAGRRRLPRGRDRPALEGRPARDDPPASEPFGLPLSEEEAKLALTRSRNAPDTGEALARIREAVGDSLLVGEVYLPSAKWQPYLEHLDTAFAFELLHAPWDAERLGTPSRPPRPAGARGCSRTTTSAGSHSLRRRERACGRPAPAHPAGPRVPLPGRRDRAGRRSRAASACTTGPADRFRHPMQWDGSPAAGSRRGDLAAAGGSRAHECRGPARRPALDPLAGARPAGAAARSRRRPRGRGCAPGCSPTAAVTTRWP